MTNDYTIKGPPKRSTRTIPARKDPHPRKKKEGEEEEISATTPGNPHPPNRGTGTIGTGTHPPTQSPGYPAGKGGTRDRAAGMEERSNEILTQKRKDWHQNIFGLRPDPDGGRLLCGMGHKLGGKAGKGSVVVKCNERNI